MSLSSLDKLDTQRKGAFGTVSLVRHKNSNNVYALKQLDKGRVVAKRQESRVQSERAIMEKYGKHFFITT
jgi:hypothetical protein